MANNQILCWQNAELVLWFEFFFLGKRWKVFVCSSPLAVCQKEHMASACPNCLWKGPLETLWRCGDGLAARMSLCWKCKLTKPSFPRHKEVYYCGPQQLALSMAGWHTELPLRKGRVWGRLSRFGFEELDFTGSFSISCWPSKKFLLRMLNVLNIVL